MTVKKAKVIKIGKITYKEIKTETGKRQYNFKKGDKIIMNEEASRKYSYTKTGVKGIVKGIAMYGLYNVYFPSLGCDYNV